MNAREFVRRFLYARSEVDDWIAGRAFPFGKYDPELGYVHRDHRWRKGVDDSVATYTYDARTRARRIINHAEVPCRINTYGDSFTHGDQVNDGETWQEILAAHLGEPIRNFGVGGYSVYQIYLRMKLEEARFPAKYLIVNIYDDDHYRSLVGWQQMRFGRDAKHFCPPQPYVTANPVRRDLQEFGNPSPSPENLYNFCDLDWVCERFKDDFALRILLAKANSESGTPEESYKDMEELAGEYGIDTAIGSRRKLLEVANELYTKAALYASRRIVENIQRFAASQGKKVLYITSYSTSSLAERLEPGARIPVPERRRPGYSYSPEFVRFMREMSVPWVNLLEVHAKEFATTKLKVASYLKGYYVRHDEYGTHYGPLGNHLTAFATKDALVEMLDPKPVTYQRTAPLDRRDTCVPV